MNILTFNQNWFVEEWRAAGHNVLCCGSGPGYDVEYDAVIPHIDNVLRQLPHGFSPDLLVFFDNSSPLMVSGLDETDIPTVFYSVDVQHHHEMHLYLYNLFDRMFIAQKDYLGMFHHEGKNPGWLPLWASRYMEPAAHKNHGAVFVGTLNAKLNPERVQFFDSLRQKAEILCTTGEFWNIFPSSEIVINQTVKGDLNFRVFEAMMSGALLLTEKSGNGLFELFQDGVHLVTYDKGNVDQAAAIIRERLADIPGTRAIAAAGRDLILREHTSAARAQQMLSQILDVPKRQHNQKCFSCALNFSVVARRCEPVHPGVTATALVLTLKSAELALRKGETLCPHVAFYIVRACFIYERVFQSGAGDSLIFALHEAYPEHTMFGLARVRIMLNRGQREQAEQLARKISYHADHMKVFENAELMIQSMMRM